MKFRKKPVVVEAFQMTKEARQSNSNWPNWLREGWGKQYRTAGAVGCSEFPHSDGTDQLVIWTLEGEHLVGWGDWIIQGIRGELYPCKNDIFLETYEKVEE